MRAAFCFSGELRSIDRTFDLIKQRIFDKFAHYDVFYHGWEDDPDINKLNILENHPNTKNIKLDSRITLPEHDYELFKRPEVNIQGMLRQLYCLKISNQLKSDYEIANNLKYDVVFRIRPDMFILNNSKLEAGVNDWNMDAYMYTSDHDDHHGYNDRFYFSSSENMNILANRLDRLTEYRYYRGVFHYETFFKYIVDREELKVCRSQIQFGLLRTDGSISSELI